MNRDDRPVSDRLPPPASGPSLTPRAIAIGALAVVTFALATPYNDWQYTSSYLYCHFMPPGVTLLVLVLALGVNPLLGARRLRLGELAVITGMLLVLGGVVSSGLNRFFAQVIAGPAKLLTSTPELAPLAPANGDVVLPTRFFVGLPEHGPIRSDDAEYRYVVDGFNNGLVRGDLAVGHRTVVAWRTLDGVTHRATACTGALAVGGGDDVLDLDVPPGRLLAGHHAGDEVETPTGRVRVLTVERSALAGVPWDAWAGPLLHWLPILLGAFVCCLALAALVRRQWIDHERLPYPIANVLLAIVADPDPGQRLAPLFRARLFWVGLAIAGTVLITQGLKTWGMLPVAIPTHLDFRTVFGQHAFDDVYAGWAITDLVLWFSVAGLAFFLPLDLGFSLWFFFVATVAGVGLLRAQGVPVTDDQVSSTGVGGFAVQCLLIMWVGRRYYLQVLRMALLRSGDPALREVAPYVWLLLAGIAAMAATLVLNGALWYHALLTVLIFLGFLLVLARVVAEAGLPFLQIPTGYFLSKVVFSITGFHLPLAALAPLLLIGTGLMGDTRENLLAFGVQAEYLGQRAGTPRLAGSAVLFVVVVVGALLSGAAMLVIYYGGEHPADPWPHYTLLEHNLKPLANGSSGVPTAEVWPSYGLGAGITAVLGIGRMLFSAWPLHPLGYVVASCYPTWLNWFSVLVGWSAKCLVLRYGGPQLYQRMRPLAIGLIVGEALASVLFMVLTILLHLCGVDFATHPSFLPR